MVEKVFPIKQIDGKRFVQEFLLVESGGRPGAKDKPYMIQVWAETKQRLYDIDLTMSEGERIVCDVYVNGYQYQSTKYGTQYGVRIHLIEMRPA